jgi:ribonuclease J
MLRSATPKGRILQLVIHKGSQEIGGTCVELSHDATTILLDLGLPLKEGSKPVDVSTLKPDAVFVSHPHQDHYGLIVDANPSIPIYMSELGKRLIDAARIFSHQPQLSNDFHFFEPWVPTSIGPFKITPYLMDHSSPDSFAFLVEADGKRLFYTGDLRAHGRKGVLFERLIENPPPDIDVLLMEGTMLGRTSDDFQTESAVEDEIVETIKGQRNTSFVICSASTSSSPSVDSLILLPKRALTH